MNKLTPEQRVIKILKDRLPIDMHHYQYQELAEEILTANTEPEDEPKTLSELFEYEDATLTEDAQLNVGKEEWLDIMSSGPTYVSPISNKTCDHTKLTEGCPACHEWATGTPAHTEPEDEPKYATMEEVFPEFTAEDEPKKKTVLCFQGEEYELKPPPQQEDK